MNPNRLKAYGMILSAIAIWGIASSVIKYTLQGIDPLSFLTYRFFIAALFGIIAIVITKSFSKKIITNLPIIALYGTLVSTVALGLLFLGLDRTTVLASALITATGPLLRAFASYILLKEHITKREKIGIGVGFLGSLFIILEPVLNGTIDFGLFIGNILVLGYVLTDTYSSVLSKQLLRKDINAFALTNMSFIFGFISMVIITLLFSTPQSVIDKSLNLPLNYQAGVFYMALISGTLAYALWVRAQKTIKVSEAGVFAYLLPLFSTPIAVIWLGEKITPGFIIGAIIIFIGVVLAEYKASRYKSHK